MRRRRRKGLDWLRLNALSNFRLAPILVRIVVSFFIPVTRFKLCPKCRDGTDIHDWYGDISRENEELWALSLPTFFAF